MSSSLSRAVQNSGATTSASSNNPLLTNTQEGKFESCFAQGLDLSEFSSSASNNKNDNHNITATTSTPQPISASAQLLKIKQKESLRRQEQERQDAQMEQMAQERAIHCKDNITRAASSKGVAAAALSKDNRHTDRYRSKFMGSLLAQMHQGDDKTTSSKATRKKQQLLLRAAAAAPQNAKSSKTRNSKNNPNNSKKAKVAFKSKKRSKY